MNWDRVQARTAGPNHKTSRRHDMPFGASPLVDGPVRFGLWAPVAKCVELCVQTESGNDRVIPMRATVSDWHEITTRAAGTGTRYRYRIDGSLEVPDPASRFQPEDVHGYSQVMDACAWPWRDGDWQGRPWSEAVIYEVHVGAFSQAGTFTAVRDRLDDLQKLGITALELMPVADFPGRRNWGYDGTLLFAPDSSYGTPDDLKDLVQCAHARGMMVLLDVVYNHFGPEGNYLHHYAPQVFTERHHTPWGAAVNLDGQDSHWVRAFYLHNALYWLEEFHFDGLRIDAVHALKDDSQPDFLTELANAVHKRFDEVRQVHLILENDNNAAHYLKRNTAGDPALYTAQWNDDVHHALHLLLTGESQGYYEDYADDPLLHLGRALAEGFAWQGEPSPYRDGQPRGEPSADLPPTAFVSFLQNHDQIGNRALGERLHTLTSPDKLRAALAIQLLAPSPPLMFMGDDWGSSSPFPFFCDFGEDLAAKVTEGRRREFARFPEFSSPQALLRIPDPCAPETFLKARLNWEERDGEGHRQWSALYHELLAVRHTEITPYLADFGGGCGEWDRPLQKLLRVAWHTGGGIRLILLFNASDQSLDHVPFPDVPLLYATPSIVKSSLISRSMPPWCAAWFLDRGKVVP